VARIQEGRGATSERAGGGSAKGLGSAGVVEGGGGWWRDGGGWRRDGGGRGREGDGWQDTRPGKRRGAGRTDFSSLRFGPPRMSCFFPVEEATVLLGLAATAIAIRGRRAGSGGCRWAGRQGGVLSRRDGAVWGVSTTGSGSGVSRRTTRGGRDGQSRRRQRRPPSSVLPCTHAALPRSPIDARQCANQRAARTGEVGTARCRRHPRSRPSLKAEQEHSPPAPATQRDDDDDDDDADADENSTGERTLHSDSRIPSLLPPHHARGEKLVQRPRHWRASVLPFAGWEHVFAAARQPSARRDAASPGVASAASHGSARIGDESGATPVAADRAGPRFFAASSSASLSSPSSSRRRLRRQLSPAGRKERGAGEKARSRTDNTLRSAGHTTSIGARVMPSTPPTSRPPLAPIRAAGPARAHVLGSVSREIKLCQGGACLSIHPRSRHGGGLPSWQLSKPPPTPSHLYIACIRG